MPDKHKTSKDISIVIPAYNEELILERNAIRLWNYFNSVLNDPWELVIADNGSTDKTGEVGYNLSKRIHNIRYLRIDEKGIGIALKKAWASCSSYALCYTDADLPYKLEEVRALCKAIFAGYDIAVGSRYIKGGRYDTTLGRKILSRLYSYWLRLLLSCSFSDHCGTKAIKRESSLSFFLYSIIMIGFLEQNCFYGLRKRVIRLRRFQFTLTMILHVLVQ